MKNSNQNYVMFFIIVTLYFMSAPLIISAGAEDKPGKVENFFAAVVRADAPDASTSIDIFITIEHWNSPKELIRLYDILMEKGENELFQTIRMTNAGFIRFDKNLTMPISIASSVTTEKGRLVRLLLEHPVLYVEPMSPSMSPRSRDYEFGYIEFIVNNKAEGSLISAVKVKLSKEGQFEIEALTKYQPYKLIKVKSQF